MIDLSGINEKVDNTILNCKEDSYHRHKKEKDIIANQYNEKLIKLYDREVKCKQNQEIYLGENLLLLKTLVWNVKEDFISKELYINFCFNPEESLEKIELYEYISISDIIELSKENI